MSDEFEIRGATFLIQPDGSETPFNPALLSIDLMNHIMEIIDSESKAGNTGADVLVANWKSGRDASIRRGGTKKGERRINIKKKKLKGMSDLCWRCQMMYDYGKDGKYGTVAYASTPLVAFAMCSVIAEGATVYQEFVKKANPDRDLTKNPMSEDEKHFVMDTYISILHPGSGVKVMKS